MTLFHIEIDDDALKQAKRLGGHQTDAAVVAAALEEYNERRTQTARYFELARGWDIEGAEAAHRAEKDSFARATAFNKPGPNPV
ncbi:type II toxin-antitoxin system VapB family antitoxin [Nocardia cyriacigeorgica]|uniref:DUF2191 domain-containing protein n=1 Tax=Nocardia cyriacigeorgica TaxID=135487 RepID=A0A5R8NFC9_9NOCA|nr:type II toxin-antitoxin system VapB family antitoxin [Nocardia cyriacigeorgica]TLF74360.1 DUF2191 domain-containing protein [Nocardia cyriacigeorgica]